MSIKKTVMGTSLAAIFATMYMPVALGAVSPEEAKELGGATLTKFGAERAANADGSIPAYTGGLIDPKLTPADDPFADEKPLYSVDATNMAEYEDMLTEGSKALMNKHSDFRIDVYPTHRTMHYPDWVLENTIKNATTATLGGDVEGDNLLGVGENEMPFAGIPFPIPQNGYEVMWNNTAKYVPAMTHIYYSSYLVDTAGEISTLPHLDGWYLHPQYDRGSRLTAQVPERTVFGFNATLTDPPSSAGLIFLNFYTARGDEGGQRVWFYTPGQRRVRMAPEFAYDVPIASYGGVTIWDEIWGFVGRLDRFEFKLVGKKEMLVPYNIRIMSTEVPVREIFGPEFVNPDLVRYEKHRVWVVEAIRKPDVRHVYSRRTFYIDEDTWSTVVQDAYDDAGQLYRAVNVYTNTNPGELGGSTHYSWQTYDLIKGNYFIIGLQNGPNDGLTFHDSLENVDRPPPLTPRAVQASGIR